MIDHIASDLPSELVCIVGDFNEHFELRTNLHDLWPPEHTCWKHSESQNFISSPDGVFATNHLKNLTKVEHLRANYKTQHGPIRANIVMEVLLRDVYTWNKGVSGTSTKWNGEDTSDFISKASAILDRAKDPSKHDELQRQVDQLWQRRRLLSRGPTTSLQKNYRWGAWMLDDSTMEISNLFAKVRRLR